MGPKKRRKHAGTIEIPTDTPTESQLGYTGADIQRWIEEREPREWEENSEE